MTEFNVFHREFEDSARPYPLPNNTYVLGVCTGSVAAAAVSCSSSLSELLPLAVQASLIAFRLGLCALDVRDRLVKSAEERRRSWSVVVTGLDAHAAESAIRAFCQENVSCCP